MTNREIAYRFVKNFQKTNPKKSPLILLDKYYSLGSSACFDWACAPEGASFWGTFYGTRMNCNENRIREFLKINYFDIKNKESFINLQFIL